MIDRVVNSITFKFFTTLVLLHFSELFPILTVTLGELTKRSVTVLVVLGPQLHEFTPQQLLVSEVFHLRDQDRAGQLN